MLPIFLLPCQKGPSMVLGRVLQGLVGPFYPWAGYLGSEGAHSGLTIPDIVGLLPCFKGAISGLI